MNVEPPHHATCKIVNTFGTSDSWTLTLGVELHGTLVLLCYSSRRALSSDCFVNSLLSLCRSMTIFL